MTKGYSSLLIAESPLTFQPSLAVLIGVNEAIALQQVNYWLTRISRNKDNAATHFKDGRWWVYNTYNGWREDNFPFWSIPTIRRTLNNLEKLNLLISAQYDKKVGNCQKWYSIDFNALSGLTAPCDHHDQTPCDRLDSPPDHIDQSLGSHRHLPEIKVIRSYIDTETTSETTSEISNSPLTPQGGNGAIASEISQNSESRSEQAEDQQSSTVKKEAKQSGGKRAGKGSARAAKRQQTTEQILALLPEVMQTRFDKFWRGYSAFCDERQAKAGPKKQAAVAWKFLVEGNFNGRGFEAYEDGVRKFLKQQGDRTTGIPHASRFLFSTANGSGAWEDALEQAASKGSVSDLSGGVGDRGHSPPVRTAADFAFPEASPPPAHIKAQIAALRGRCA